MPAPLAKGIIIAASVLIAAGVAVYENPQVREWVDQSRRKIAIALHSLGDDVQPTPTAEDMEQERRTQREELMYWNMKRDEQRRKKQQQQQQQQASKTSFDEMVTKDGTLKEADDARNTATEIQETDNGLRRRNHVHKEAEPGAAQTNPFADHNESHVLFDQSLVKLKSTESDRHSRSSTATLPASQDPNPTQPSPPPSASQPQEPLVDLTSSTESSQSPHHNPSNYWSVNEWAESTSPSYYEASIGSDQYTAPQTPSIRSSAAASLAGSGEDVGGEGSVDGGEGGYLDVLSEDGISTPESWTEVGSEVSEGDVGRL